MPRPLPPPSAPPAHAPKTPAARSSPRAPREPAPRASTIAADKLARFSKLRTLRAESKALNKTDVHAEHAKSKDNPKELVRQKRKLQEAEELLAKTTAEREGQDYERIKNLEYTVDDVERWEDKLAQKEARKDLGFTDFTQVAAKKYGKMIAELKPDISKYRQQRELALARAAPLSSDPAAAAAAAAGAAGAAASGDHDFDADQGDAAVLPAAAAADDAFFRSAHSLAYADPSHTPSPDAVERLARDVEKQQLKRGKFSRRRAFDEDADVTYINERNMRFNKKIARAYDKYTAEIKANFERGTAL
ncbi:Pre-mRNA-splicing factor SYF2 [Polyrhizophydium stewartii]|uniref:Pre-mRNA-splicing factor SYF2 n=1 Tax=Polyrhizophydium stewartii TaxID=2732419 RepID=A0ABR4N822_9FUNG